MIDEKEMMMEDFDTACQNFIASPAGQEIVEQGMRNYLEGDGQGHNPYSDETVEYWAWDDGWLASYENFG